MAAGPAEAVICGDALLGAETTAHAYALHASDTIATDQVTRATPGSISAGDQVGMTGDFIDTQAYAHTGDASRTARIAAFTRHGRANRFGGFDNTSDIEAGISADYIICSSNSLAGTTLSLSDYSVDFAYRIRLRAPDTATVVTPFNLHGGRAQGTAFAGTGSGTKTWTTAGETEGISETDFLSTHPVLEALIAEYSIANPANTPLDLSADALLTVDNTLSIGTVPRPLTMRLNNDSYIESFATGPVEIEQQLVLVGARSSEAVPAGAGLLFASGLFLPLVGEATGLPTGGNAIATALPGTLASSFVPDADALSETVPMPAAAGLLALGLAATLPRVWRRV